MAKYFPGKPDYDYNSAILGGLFFSMILFFNIFTVLITLGCDKIITIVFANLGFVGFFLFMHFPFLFVYFTCIHKKKYLEILERFCYMDKNWKKRLLSALIGMSYMGVSFFLFAFAFIYLK